MKNGANVTMTTKNGATALSLADHLMSQILLGRVNGNSGIVTLN